jgi:hypothetical protein
VRLVRPLASLRRFQQLRSTVYKDLDERAEAVAQWTPMLASNAVHLARLLKKESYPGKG